MNKLMLTNIYEMEPASFNEVVQPTRDHKKKPVLSQKRGVMVKGGKKGRGPPCMTVNSLQEHFRKIAASKNIQNSEKLSINSTKF